MAKTAEKTYDLTWQDLARELDARSSPWTNEELFALLRRVPPLMPPGWSSADDIRELRGPLPEDDPDFPNVDRR
jgi:hypothetical protein